MLSAEERTAWKRHTDDDRLPLWLRVFSLALDRCDVTGTARMECGETADLLTFRSRERGGKPDRQEVYRAVRTAVEYGFLLPGSTARRLIVAPDHRKGIA